MDASTGELFAGGRGPRDKSHAIEAHQSAFGADPQVSIRRLGDGLRSAGEETILNAPRGVRILRDFAAGIESYRRQRKQDRSQEKQAAENGTKASDTLFFQSGKKSYHLPAFGRNGCGVVNWISQSTPDRLLSAPVLAEDSPIRL